jgi:hypothetical protein
MPVFILSLGIFYLQSRYLIHQEAMERSNSVLSTAIQRVSNFMNTIENTTGKLNGNHIVMSPSISHSSGSLAP